MSDKKRKSVESELGEAGEAAVPILAPGIGTRIKAVCDAIGSRESAAKAAGVSTDMLYRYFREESTPSFEAIVGLAARSGFNLDWLATGEGPELRDSGVGETAARYQGFELPESFEARMERLDWAKRLVQAALRSAGLVEDDRLSTLLLGLVFEGRLDESSLRTLIQAVSETVGRARTEAAADGLRAGSRGKQHF